MRRVLVIALALVACRAAVWVLFEQAHFDSDQAIIGLMAKHLAEGRALPLFFYGQHYMLAVEPWIDAPVFKIFGASVLTVKLPLVIINGVVAVLLIRRLVGHVGLTPMDALVASLFFLVPPPVTASRLVESAGGSIEPFLYALLLWSLRERAIAFGLLAGVAVLHREFSVYAITSLVAIDVITGRLRDRARWRFYAVAAAGIVLVAATVGVLKVHADLLGPGTGGTLPPDVVYRRTPFWTSVLCWQPGELAANFRWLITSNLSTIFGWHVGPLGNFARSALTTGAAWAWVPLAGVLGLSAAASWFRAGTPATEARTFPPYLALIGLQAGLVYAGLGCAIRDPMLIRYTLLTLLVPVGAVAWALARRPPAWMRGAIVALALLWAAPAAVDHARVIDEYVRHPPQNAQRALLDFLEAQGVRYGRAPYWTAYYLDFISREHIVIASFDKVRVDEYERIVDAHSDRSVGIFETTACPSDTVFLQWCISDLGRARNTGR